MEMIETVITVTTDNPNKAFKFARKKEKEGFEVKGHELKSSQSHTLESRFTLTLSKLEQFK